MASAAKRCFKGGSPPQRTCRLCGDNISALDPHTICLYCLGHSHAYDGAFHIDEPGACEACRQLEPRRLRRRLNRFNNRTGRNDGDGGGEPFTSPRPEDDTQAPPGPDYRSLGARPRRHNAAAVSPTAARGSDHSEAEHSPARSWRAPRSNRNTARRSNRYSPSPDRTWGDRVDEEGGPPPQYDRFEDVEWSDQNSYSVLSRYDREEVNDSNGEDNSSDAASDYMSPPRETQATASTAAMGQAALPAARGSSAITTAEDGSLPPTPGRATDLPELFKTAALKCGLAWPAEEEQAAEEPSVWEQLQPPDAAPLVKRRLPLAKGFKKALTLSWDKPASFTWPKHLKPKKIDCVATDDLALEGLPLPDAEVATHLLQTPGVDPKHPKFLTKRDRDFSSFNAKIYDQQASIAGTLNAMAILQGATTAMINTDTSPSVEELAQLKRLHHETMLLTKTVTEQVGRSMSLIVTLERSMWANLAVKTSPAVREDLLNLPIDHKGLLIGGLNMLVEAHTSGQRNKEAMNALLPTDRPKVKAKPLRVNWTPQERRFPDWPPLGARHPTPHAHPQPPASRSPCRSRDADHTGPQTQPAPASPGGGRGGGRRGRGRSK